MKAKLYRESPVLLSALQEKGEADKYPKVCPDSPQHRMVEAGYIVDHPDAWLLCLQGIAVAADDECEKKVKMSPEHRVRRYERQKALEAGKLTGDPKLDVPIKHS